MRISFSTAMITILLLGLVGAFVFPRWVERSADGRAYKARRSLVVGAERIRDYAKRKGAIPPSLASGGSPGSTIPDGVAWGDLVDPTSPESDSRIRYWAGPGQSWILSAMGTDKVADASPADWMFVPAAATDARWSNLNYDPTNGMFSRGDVMLASWQDPRSVRSSR